MMKIVLISLEFSVINLPIRLHATLYRYIFKNQLINPSTSPIIEKLKKRLTENQNKEANMEFKGNSIIINR